MEFIPLEKSTKGKEEGTGVKNKLKKLNKEGKIGKQSQKKEKKLQTKIVQKKVINSKSKETGKKNKFTEKATKKKKLEEEEEEEAENIEEKEDEEEINEGSDEEVEVSEASEDTADDEEEALKKKCKEMDEKKKNRLFIKLNKKILNETQIKELHPDIRSVIFPRKKKTRWCWAVFASEEKARRAMMDLIKNKDILVTKPTPYIKVVQKRKEKMKTILRKKQAKKKLQEMWM